MMNNTWTNAKEEQPKKQGEYLCAVGDKHYHVSILTYVKDLSKYDDVFKGRDRPGWVDTNDPFALIEVKNVAYWMPTPSTLITVPVESK